MKCFALALLVAISAAFDGTPSIAAAPAPNDYTNPVNWLCRPGRADPCAADQTATVVNADGRETIERFAADPNAPIDCFYVYPTASLDRTPNSDMIPDADEKRVTSEQVGRLESKCRVYVPMYRQVTVMALEASNAGKPMPGASRELAYGDVRDAWKEY